MKLKVPKLYSQRNSSWSPELLGYNTNPIYNISGWGCLITSFSMYIDKTPHEVNELLKANNGYTAGSGNFIWGKSTVLGLTQVYQSPYYAAEVTLQGLTKMRALLDEGRPLICHVDFDPKDSDDDQHWVLIYGYDDNDIFYMQDPWSGLQATLDVYGGVKRAVLEWRAYDKILPKDIGVDEMTQCRVDRDTNHNDRMALYEELGFTGVFNRTVAIEKIRQLLALEKQFVEKDEQLKDAQVQIDTLKRELVEVSVSHDALQDSYEALHDNFVKDTATITDLTQKLKDLEEKIKAPVVKGWKSRLIAFLQSI